MRGRVAVSGGIFQKGGVVKGARQSGRFWSGFGAEIGGRRCGAGVSFLVKFLEKG